MTQSSNEQTLKKCSDMLDKVGLSGPKSDRLEEYAKLQEQSEQSKKVEEKTKPEDFPSLLPIAMKIAAKKISSDLIFASQEEINEVKNKVLTENRDGKIDAIVEGKDFTEKKLEDDEEYQKLMKKGVNPLSAPKGQLFYMDFKYESNHKKLEELVKNIKRKMANKYVSPGIYTRDYWIPVRNNALDRKVKINKIFDLKIKSL